MRSPRSVRTVDLPFMLGASESAHPHRLAAKARHQATASKAEGSPFNPDKVEELVGEAFGSVTAKELSLTELWGMPGVAGACAGSKRWLVACLGGWGDVADAWEGVGTSGYVVEGGKSGLVVRRK